MAYVLCLILLAVGLYGALAKRNLTRIIVGLAVMEAAGILLVVIAGYSAGGASDPVAHLAAVLAFLVAAVVIAMAAWIAAGIRARSGRYDVKDINRFKE